MTHMMTLDSEPDSGQDRIQTYSRPLDLETIIYINNILIQTIIFSLAKTCFLYWLILTKYFGCSFDKPNHKTK